jgi:hypothetical protein
LRAAETHNNVCDFGELLKLCLGVVDDAEHQDARLL